ncbi:glycosyltransferase [Streptosporangium sp. NBC_01755]|uniref:glycosyltransferase n=1 Tax=unclassified Streptosporangium TaxID=2632669 RepID=UPI002DDC3A89|nr:MULTISPECIES: glycosyltransferase [unclassified Streptosporangium]WSA25665.1 glycosyltransferase [Streptosporangium sp. NBC_01810]WSD02945.1 glycosyltransferase [Streptosporangium sp. NBC_01755]
MGWPDLPAGTRSHDPLFPHMVDERRSLRILLGTDTYPPDMNGTARSVQRLASELVMRGHEVHVVCQSDHGPPRVESVDGVRIHRLRSVPVFGRPMARVTAPVWSRGTVERVIGRIAPDVVHVQGHLIVGRTVLGAALRSGIPVVATGHVAPDRLFRRRGVPARVRAVAADLAWHDLARVFNGADHVTVPTAIAADLFRGRGLTRPVEPVVHGVDPSRFRPRERAKASVRRELGLPERATALYVGRLGADRRLEDLVRALPYVCRRTDAQVVLAGAGLQRPRLERLADEVGVADRLCFLSPVTERDLHLTYASADVFAVPGVAGLQSVATLEAMASGLPVVAAVADALAHLVRSGSTGYLYRPGDVAALARHLTCVLTDPCRRATMGGVCRAIAVTHDHLRSLARFEEIYASLAQASRRRLAGERAG